MAGNELSKACNEKFNNKSRLNVERRLSINYLQKTTIDELLKNDKTTRSLRKMMNITVEVNQSGDKWFIYEINEWFINQGIHSILAQLLKQLNNSTKKDNVNNELVMFQIVAIFNNLTCNLKEPICKIATSSIVDAILLLLNDFFSEKRQLESYLTAHTYKLIVSILHNLAIEPSTRLYLRSNNDVMNVLFEHKQKLNDAINNGCDYPFLQVVNGDLAATLAHLLVIEQFSNENVCQLLNDLSNIISKINLQSYLNCKLVQQTKFYFSYKIGNSKESNNYLEFAFLSDYLSAILSIYDRISIDDRLLNAWNIDALLDDIIQIFELSDKELHQILCAHLLKCWCFNKNFKNKIKSKPRLVKLIQYKLMNSNVEMITNFCNMINEMINNQN